VIYGQWTLLYGLWEGVPVASSTGDEIAGRGGPETAHEPSTAGPGPCQCALVALASGVGGAAGGGSHFSSCDPKAPADAAFASGSGEAILGRGGEVREPDLGEVHADLPTSAKGRAGPAFKASVPVYFHVVTDGATGSLTDAQIAAQMDVLNVTYAGGEGGARTGFSFYLAGVTRTDNAGWFYAGPGGTNEHTMKSTLHRAATTRSTCTRPPRART
jgi:hypothetical protein